MKYVQNLLGYILKTGLLNIYDGTDGRLWTIPPFHYDHKPSDWHLFCPVTKHLN